MWNFLILYISHCSLGYPCSHAILKKHKRKSRTVYPLEQIRKRGCFFFFFFSHVVWLLICYFQHCSSPCYIFQLCQLNSGHNAIVRTTIWGACFKRSRCQVSCSIARASKLTWLLRQMCSQDSSSMTTRSWTSFNIHWTPYLSHTLS